MSFSRICDGDIDEFWAMYTRLKKEGVDDRDACDRALQIIVDYKLRPALRVADSAKRLKSYLEKSTWAGPLTNNPSLEAQILRELYVAVTDLDALTTRVCRRS